MPLIRTDARHLPLPDGYVQTVITSPPYWGLRDYGIAGQFGLEKTPQEYVEAMVEVFREVRRVLRDDGTCWLNLGDSYVSTPRGNKNGWEGSGLNGVESQTYQDTLNAGTAHTLDKTKIAGLKPKDLVGIPWRVAFALQQDGWYLRSDIIWAKGRSFDPEGAGSCMPESVRDRPTRGHEYVFLLTKSGTPTFWIHRDRAGSRTPPQPDYRWLDQAAGGMETSEEPAAWRDELLPGTDQKRWKRINLWSAEDYFYDYEAVKETSAEITRKQTEKRRAMRMNRGVLVAGEYGQTSKGIDGGAEPAHVMHSGAARNLRSVWVISPQPFRGAHFATFPEKLAETCLLAGSPPSCCPRCGAPHVRIVEKGAPLDEQKAACGADASGEYHGEAQKDYEPAQAQDASATKARILAGMVERRTIGWKATCRCDHGAQSAIPVVLDPFCGSGTVGVVAKRHSRFFIGCDLKAEYLTMAQERIDAA